MSTTVVVAANPLRTLPLTMWLDYINTDISINQNTNLIFQLSISMKRIEKSNLIFYIQILIFQNKKYIYSFWSFKIWRAKLKNVHGHCIWTIRIKIKHTFFWLTYLHPMHGQFPGKSHSKSNNFFCGVPGSF